MSHAIPSTDPLLMPSAKLEVAFRWLLEGSAGLTTPPIDAAVAFYAAQDTGKKKFPCVVCEATRCDEEAPGSGVWNFDLMVHSEAKAWNKVTAEKVARDLAGQVAQILDARDRTMACLNAPATGDPDDRAVQEFHLAGYYAGGESLSREGRVTRVSWLYTGHVHSWDVVPAARRFQG